MAKVTIRTKPAAGKSGTLAGTVTLTQKDRWRSLAVWAFVWQPTPIYGGSSHRGWRPATPYPHKLRKRGAWTADVDAGVQYAVLVVDEDFILGKHPRDDEDDHPVRDIPGTLPRRDVDDEPAFTANKHDLAILSAPDGPLTGAVLGVGRATWEPDELASRPGATPVDYFRILAWATKHGETLFVGETRCEPSGFWDFGILRPSLRSADSFSVGLVMESFNPPSLIPPTEKDVIKMTTHLRERRPTLTRAAGRPLRRR
jgi:hypothetical protein